MFSYINLYETISNTIFQYCGIDEKQTVNTLTESQKVKLLSAASYVMGGLDNLTTSIKDSCRVDEKQIPMFSEDDLHDMNKTYHGAGHA